MIIELCGDDELGYAAGRTRFAGGEGFALDEAYRLAHLPLVAPGHPKVIARKDGAPYENGRRARVRSLALPVPADLLQAQPAYRELEAELRASVLAPKIAWDVARQRRGKLHATLAHLGDAPAPDLGSFGSFTVELRGLFSGTFNLGRLYLRAYPERRAEGNVFHLLQRRLGRRETDLYLVGLFNLVDDLDPAEAAALAALIARWWDRPVLRWQVDALWLLGARDDLVLDGGVEAEIALCRPV
ncbi:MAG: hypothetical protein JSR47_07020 [Proteobacteria bacterium]|nr:hypothetical protein [Pseudomonadota bacterium]